MGVIGRVLKVTNVVLVTLFFMPGIPPYYQFEPIRATPAFELEPNSHLDKAVLVSVDKPVPNPESVAIRNDELFTGLGDGRLVKIKDGKVTNVGTFGVNCDNNDHPCGRFAGVRFDSRGKLLAVNAAFGIFRIDVDTGKYELLVSMDDVIDGVKPKFPNDVDEDPEGNIYWSDSSAIADHRELPLEALAGPTGRLVKYNPKSKVSTVLVEKICLANGVQVSENGEFVLVSDSYKARVIRHYLKGEKQGQTDIFIDGLPGVPDNIRPNGRGGFYIALILPRNPNETSPLEVLGNWPLVRRFIVRVHYILVQTLTQIDRFLFPSPLLKEWIIKLRGFGLIGSLQNKILKATVVETDGEGKVISSLQNEKGPLTLISEMSVDKSWAYFGTPTLKHLYKLKLSELSK